MHHRQRLETTLSGAKPDRSPVSLWRHFPVDDQYPYRLAASTARFQNAYDFDFIKVTPASSYCLLDWGCVDEWRGETEGTRQYVHRPIREPEDWLKLPVLKPDQGSLGGQMECLRLLVDAFRSENTPIIQTIFNPLSQAKNLAGQERMLTHLRTAPDALAAGLRTITETTLAFIDMLHSLQIDGIFYAVQHAQYSILNEDEYRTFGLVYDTQILAALAPFWLNMLHLHGTNVMFDLVADYPVQIINWHDRHTPPSLAAALDRFPGVLCGGLQREETMVLGTPEAVEAEARDALAATGGSRFILGTGCVLEITTPDGNIRAARQVVEKS